MFPEENIHPNLFGLYFSLLVKGYPKSILLLIFKYCNFSISFKNFSFSNLINLEFKHVGEYLSTKLKKCPISDK